MADLTTARIKTGPVHSAVAVEALATDTLRQSREAAWNVLKAETAHIREKIAAAIDPSRVAPSYLRLKELVQGDVWRRHLPYSPEVSKLAGAYKVAIAGDEVYRAYLKVPTLSTLAKWPDDSQSAELLKLHKQGGFQQQFRAAMRGYLREANQLIDATKISMERLVVAPAVQAVAALTREAHSSEQPRVAELNRVMKSLQGYFQVGSELHREDVPLLGLSVMLANFRELCSTILETPIAAAPLPTHEYEADLARFRQRFILGNSNRVEEALSQARHPVLSATATALFRAAFLMREPSGSACLRVDPTRRALFGDRGRGASCCR